MLFPMHSITGFVKEYYGILERKANVVFLECCQENRFLEEYDPKILK
jgi:hypothetical protein